MLRPGRRRASATSLHCATVGQPPALSLWAKDTPDTYDPEADLPADQRTRDRDKRESRAWTWSAPNFDVSAAAGAGGGRSGFAGRGQQADITVTWKVAVRRPMVCAGIVPLNDGGNHDKFQEAERRRLSAQLADTSLRAQVNDKSGDGGGGEQCCWTNALVKVTVKWGSGQRRPESPENREGRKTRWSRKAGKARSPGFPASIRCGKKTATT